MNPQKTKGIVTFYSQDNRGIFVSKDDLIKEIYLRVSDETDMGDLVKEEDFVAVVRRVLYDYILVSEASIVH